MRACQNLDTMPLKCRFGSPASPWMLTTLPSIFNGSTAISVLMKPTV